MGATTVGSPSGCRGRSLLLRGCEALTDVPLQAQLLSAPLDP